MSIYALACPLQHKTVVLSPLLLHKSGTIIHLLLSESHHHLTPSNVTSKLIAMSIADGGLYFIFPKTPPSFLWVSSSVPRALQLQDSKKVTHGEPIETHQRSFERYHPNPYDLFTKVGCSQPPPKLESLLSQERVKLRTSNLAGTFTGSIRTKAH